MRLLFAITISCFCAVLSVALSLTHRIRLGQGTRRMRTRRWFTQELFEAGEFRTPRALRLRQEIPWPRPRRALFADSVTREVPGPRNPRLMNLRPQESTVGAAQGVTVHTIPFRPTQSVANATTVGESMARKKGALIAISGPRSGVASNPLAGSLPSIAFDQRNFPKSHRPSGVRRVDLSRYSRVSNRRAEGNSEEITEMGDLSDPYTHPLRGSGTLGPVLKTP